MALLSITKKINVLKRLNPRYKRDNVNALINSLDEYIEILNNHRLSSSPSDIIVFCCDEVKKTIDNLGISKDSYHYQIIKDCYDFKNEIKTYNNQFSKIDDIIKASVIEDSIWKLKSSLERHVKIM